MQRSRKFKFFSHKKIVFLSSQTHNALLNAVNEQKPREIAVRVLGQRKASGEFVEDLLERTADWRTRLGQNILYINLLGPGVTEDDYKKYLSAIFGFVMGFEKYIFTELTEFLPDIETRRKTNKSGENNFFHMITSLLE